MATTAKALTHVGFSPDQARLILATATLTLLIDQGKFPRYKARAIKLASGRSLKTLIEQGKFTKAQATLILAAG